MSVQELTAAADKLDATGGRLEQRLAESDVAVIPHADGGGYSNWEEDEPGEMPSRIQKGIEYRPSGRRRWFPKGYKPRALFANLGTQVRAMKEDPGAFRTAYLNHYKSIQKSVQGMSEGIASDGGFTVLPEFSAKILEKTYDNSLWEETDNYTCNGNSMAFPRNSESSRRDGYRAGGVQSYWVNEGQTITGSKPTLGQLQLKLKKLAVVVYLTDELIEDTGMALEAYVTRKVAEEFKFMIGNSLINGSGAGQPQGILNSPATVSVAKETAQAAASIITKNIVNMWARLWVGSRSNASWYINQDCEAQLNTMTLGVGSGGVVTYMPPGGLSSSPYATLMGRPVKPLEFCQTCGTTGDLLLADFKQYVSLSKGGIAQAQSIHVEFLTDQTALRFIMRVDGSTWENSPVTPLNGSATQSSFIKLDTRA